MMVDDAVARLGDLYDKMWARQEGELAALQVGQVLCSTVNGIIFAFPLILPVTLNRYLK